MPPFLPSPSWSPGGAWPTCRVGDDGVAPPQRDLDLPDLRQPCGLCGGSPLVREEEPADVVLGAVPPVVAVKTAPRLGRDGLDHHPVCALEAGLSEQVLDLDVVPSLRAGDTWGDVVQGHQDPTPDHGRVVLLLQPRPCHGRQRVRQQRKKMESLLNGDFRFIVFGQRLSP
jgi:hypothetical protein